MKKCSSAIIAAIFALLFVLNASATEVAIERTTVAVTAQSTSMYERASTSSETFGNVKQGREFHVTAHTQNFWKVEFKLTGETQKQYGYLLKQDTSTPETVTVKIEAAPEPSAGKQNNSKPSTETEQIQRSTSSHDQSQATVYITNTGQKYHRSSCRHLSKSKIEITLSRAKSQGYSPCKTCNPPA